VQICGIDDAGRGSMLGPLVIAGISLDKRKLRKLSSLGVKDSKNFPPNYVNIFTKKLLRLLMIITLQKFLQDPLMQVLRNIV